MEKTNKIIIFTDGGSRGNPGKSAYGFVITKNKELLYEEGKCIGITTNNVAEYSGILESLSWVALHRELIGKISGIDVYMDSLLATQQLNGKYRVTKSHLREFLEKIKAVEKEINIPITYTHVPREQNKKADSLVNRALDNNL